MAFASLPHGLGLGQGTKQGRVATGFDRRQRVHGAAHLIDELGRTFASFSRPQSITAESACSGKMRFQSLGQIDMSSGQDTLERSQRGAKSGNPIFKFRKA